MQISTYILIATLEVFVVLVFLCLFLLLHSRKQKLLIRRQQEKLQELIQSNDAKPPVSIPQPTTTPAYKAFLAQEQESTLTHFQNLMPDGDIALVWRQGGTPEQRTAALRYMFLQAENSATTQEHNKVTLHWNTFEQQLQSLLTEDTNPTDLNTELDASKKRIENLQKFKQLFFDMEKKWQEAQENAQEYYEQLSTMADNLEDKDHFNDVLESYHNVYHQVSSLISAGKGESKVNPSTTTMQVKRSDTNAAKEIIKLRNVAADQHRIINQLQRKLESAASTSEKEIAVQELQQQLHRQVRFVQEAETCIQLLEDELDKCHDQLHQQVQQLEESSIVNTENREIKQVLYNFTLESKGLIKTILDLEQENEKLKTGPSANSKSTDPAQLKKAQTDLLALQTQYTELEEMYLNLKLKS